MAGDSNLVLVSKDLQTALVEVQKTKAAAEAAQATLDAAREQWQAAVETARQLHAAFQSAVSEVVPGIKL